MALEVASFPPQLVVTNPVPGDSVAFGGDHIRLIKRVIQSTFPKLNGAVTATQAQLNLLSDQSRLVVPGLVMMWGGPISGIPAGWKLCNGVGTISTGANVPNLVDRFIAGVGGGSIWAPYQLGGTTSHAHTASASVASHTLTIAQIPNHRHPGMIPINPVAADGFDAQDPPRVTRIWSQVATFTLGAAGGGQGHAHGATASNTNTVSHIPPAYSLSYIVKN